jgi:hypothetical protein
MHLPFSSKTLARCVALALIATPAFAGEIQSIDESNLAPDDNGNITTIYDRDVTASTDGATTSGLIAWDEVKAVVPGIAVYNNVPPQNDKQIYADCVMAPRVYSLTGDVDKACNDGFQTHKRYKMNATAVGPIDLVFKVKPNDAYAPIVDKNGDPVAADQDPTLNAYRMIGKLNNHTGKRLAGFKIELGFNIGGSFVKSTSADGVKIRLYEEGADPVDPSAVLTSKDVAEFPGGLFYGPADDKHTWGFFSSTRAYFEVDTSTLVADEDMLTSGLLSANYADNFGQWLPINWVPPGWFHDEDGNPATDDIVVAWFDGTNWITYIVDQTDGTRTEQIVNAATITAYENTPSTVWLDDGDGTTTTDGTLYATWDAENEVYTLAAGGMATNEQIAAELLTTPLLERRAGYKTGPIEDLANVNLNYYIEVTDPTAWTTYDAGTEEGTFTLRITPIEATDNTPPAWLPPVEPPVVPPVEPPVEPPVVPPVVPPVDDGATVTTDDGGGCTMATGKVPFDPTLPLLLAGGVAAIALRRRVTR